MTDLHQLAAQIESRYGLGPGDTYLSPAPLYHTAPLAYTTAAHRLGATVVVMPKFDPEGWLEAVQRYRVTLTQMVPTMFVRLLKLAEEKRKAYDLTSLRNVIHAAARHCQRDCTASGGRSRWLECGHASPSQTR